MPVALVAHDPAVLKTDLQAGAGLELHPASEVPTVPMNEFRDRFLAAYGSHPTGP